MRRGQEVSWRVQRRASARSGAPGRGDHVVARALACSPWLGIMSSEVRVMMSTGLTRLER
jgi:hypothetical protein